MKSERPGPAGGDRDSISPAANPTEDTEAQGGARGIRQLCLFLLLAVALVLVSLCTPAGRFFQLENIRHLSGHLGPWGPCLLILAGLLTPLLFLPRWPIAFVAGLLYGVVWGTLLATAASTLGAMLQFALAKSLLAPVAERLRHRHAFMAAPIPREKAFLAIFLLRAFPLSSFVATNLLAGAMKMPFGSYVVASFLGMIPSSLMYAAWGKLLKKPDAPFFALAIASVLFITIGTFIAQKRFYPWLKGRRAAADGGRNSVP